MLFARISNAFIALTFLALVATEYKKRVVPIPDPPHQGAPASATSDDTGLPADCTIIATIAYEKLAPLVKWCKILALRLDAPDLGISGGHTMVVWKLSDTGHVLIYDRQGTLDLETSSTKIEDITAAMQKKFKDSVKITAAHYIE